MRVSVLTGKKSYQAAFKYNYDKVLEGSADIQYCGNIPGQDPVFPHRLPIQDAFMRYIGNPAVSERLRNEVLHLSFSPGPDDITSREQVVYAIGEALVSAGYGDNPYVVFRHNDIDREHFHVITPTVDETGKCIEKKTGKNVMFMMLERMEELGPSLGFTMRDTEEMRLRRLGGDDAEPTPGLAECMRHAFEEAMSFDFDTDFQFRCLMDLRNILVKKSRNKTTGEEFLLFQKSNAKREAVSRPISANRLYDGRDCLAHYRARLAENVQTKSRRMKDNTYIVCIIEECRKMSLSLADFRQALADCGVSTTPSFSEDGRTVRKMSVIDAEHRRIYNYADIRKGYKAEDLDFGQYRHRPSRVPMLSPEQVDEIKHRAHLEEQQAQASALRVR